MLDAVAEVHHRTFVHGESGQVRIWATYGIEPDSLKAIRLVRV
jgi:hypothetical protein